jgi:hypothetical protein
MVARTLIVVMAAVAVARSDNRQHNLARCKARVVELYRPPADEREWKRAPLIYLHECMMASGYRLNTTEGGLREGRRRCAALVLGTVNELVSFALCPAKVMNKVSL